MRPCPIGNWRSGSSNCAKGGVGTTRPAGVRHHVGAVGAQPDDRAGVAPLFPKAAYTTLQTTLARLQKKGPIAVSRRGLADAYWPTMGRQKLAAAIVESFLNSRDRGRAKAVRNAFRM